MDEWRDRLDEAIDDALASYGKAPESEGLERRILARVTEAPRSVYPAKALVLAAGVAAIALSYCLIIWMTPKTLVQPLPPSMASANVGAPRMRMIPEAESAAVPATVEKPRRIRAKAAEPKLAQFPAPSGLSSEERALMHLAQTKDSLRQVTNLGRPVTPINIAAVEIRPIGSGWSTKEKECCDQ